MRLSQIHAALGDLVTNVRHERDVDISGVAYDSRQVAAGTLFVAIEGFKTDGHRFVPQAVAAGAAALIVNDTSSLAQDPGVPTLRVTNSRRALAVAGAAFYNWPAHQLRMFGVTGTNGKTTTTFLIESILRQAGRKPGLIGTMVTQIGGVVTDSRNTTPESLDLQQMLAGMRAAGQDCAVMEVSSHGLALDRVAACPFDVAVFTNLTQDHLDFHKDMDDYFNAKRILFATLGHDNPKPGPLCAVANADDERCDQLRASVMADIPFISYGLSVDADLRASDIEHRPDGTRFMLHSKWGERQVKLQLSGLFNVYNALAAIGAALGDGIDLDRALLALEETAPVRGRFQTVRCGQPYAVVVDYAHTPDGLENILKAARDITTGRVLVVFGCGGDRDRTKRPKMGAIAANLADEVFVTSDNPRTEEPAGILAEIMVGVENYSAKAHVEVDRRTAIAAALAAARPGDTVVIAGKGHETYQILKDRTIHFDDVEVATEILEQAVAG
jgi:UDP-N-acetylmuramoyl-L-alanyl-D-glutamate--2,6-diaminopimelate ligase